MIYQTKKHFIAETENGKYKYSFKIYGNNAEKLAILSEKFDTQFKNFIYKSDDDNCAIINIYSHKYGYYEVYIDIEDINKIQKFKWRIHKDKNHNTIYCDAHKKIGKKDKKIQLHRLIMNCPADKLVDHIDRNGLNNRKENLRITNLSINGKNSSSQKNKKHKDLPTGVYYNEKNKQFKSAWVDHNNKQIWRVFSVKTYGFKMARFLAIKCRYDNCKKYNYDMSDISKYIKNVKVKKV